MNEYKKVWQFGRVTFTKNLTEARLSDALLNLFGLVMAWVHIAWYAPILILVGMDFMNHYLEQYATIHRTFVHREGIKP